MRNSGEPRRGTSHPVRRWIAAAAAGVTLAQAPAALAWEPSTHAYLAQKALDDAFDDGMVTLYFVDFTTGEFQRDAAGRIKQASFAVEPRILDALRRYPEKFLAGALGPDAYPDIVSGQERIHPPGAETGNDTNPRGPGTDPWLQQLWTAAWQDGAPDKLAWTVGFLAHAAGDMYAHTFMNTFAGGIFDMSSDNFLKHITLEGYVGERTHKVHPLQPAGRAAATAYDLVQQSGIAGIEDFIAEHTYDTPGFPDEAHRLVSVPYVVGHLRDALRAQLDAYHAFDSRLADDLAMAAYLASPPGAAQEIAWACGGNACPDARYPASSCPTELFPRGGACVALTLGGGIFAWSAGWATVAATLGAALVTERATAQPFIVAQHNRLDGANRALVDWVKGSHRAGTSLFFQASGLADTGAAAASYEDFRRDFLPIATGLPEPVCDGIETLSQFLHLPQTDIDRIASEVRGDVLGWLFQQAFHMTVADARDRFTKPHIWLDQLLGSGRPAMTLASANALMRVPPTSPATCRDPLHPGMDVSGACDLVTATADNRSGVQYFTVDPPGVEDNGAAQRVFPAAFNTVTMIKLSLINPADVERLIDSLKQPGAPTLTLGPARGAPVAPRNAMLGFAATIDGSHQWGVTRYGAARQMIAARDCHRYQQLFLDQRPDIDAGLHAIPFAQRPSPPSTSPWEPDAATTCASPSSLPDLELAPSQATVAFPDTVRFTASARSQFSAGRGTVAPSTDGLHAIYRPSDELRYGGDDVVRAVDGAGREARAIVHVQSSFRGAVLRNTAAINRGPFPHGDPALRAGERVTLVSPSATPMTWTIVRGPGAIGDAAARAAATAVLRVHQTQLAAFDARVRAPTVKLAVPGCTGACSKQATAELAKLAEERRTYLAAHATEIRDAERKAAAAAALYIAPAKITADDVVTLRGVAADGTKTTLSLRLAAPPPPLVLKAAPRTVKPGADVSLELAAGIAMDWSLVPGSAGSLGNPTSPRRAALDARIRGEIAALQPAAARLAHARPHEATAARQALTDAILALTKSAGPAFAELQAIDATYHAPTQVAGPTRVTLRGETRDGTGRTLDVAFDVVP